jgi:hypothetical protein
MYIILDSMYVTMSISTGLCPDWDLWTANKLQLELQLLTAVLCYKVITSIPNNRIIALFCHHVHLFVITANSDC